jgi:hypothetical protein
MRVWVVYTRTRTRIPDGYRILSNNVPTGRKFIPYPPLYRVIPVGYSGFGYPLPSLDQTELCYVAHHVSSQSHGSRPGPRWPITWTSRSQKKDSRDPLSFCQAQAAPLYFILISFLFVLLPSHKSRSICTYERRAWRCGCAWRAASMAARPRMTSVAAPAASAVDDEAHGASCGRRCGKAFPTPRRPAPRQRRDVGMTVRDRTPHKSRLKPDTEPNKPKPKSSVSLFL